MLLALATPAGAATAVNYTFNTTGSMGDNGVYGQPLQFSAKNGASTLSMQVTGWQSRQATNDITKAYLGAYSGGLGVTGLGDTNGANAYHQIDNVGGYTDFVMLQFDRAVTLSGVTLNTYNMTGVTGRDSDLAYYNAGALTSKNWNTLIDLTAYDTVPLTWTGAAGGDASGSRILSAAGASNKWLVGAAFLPTIDRDDGFKIASISVTESVSAVPEPATWAMMLVGFGAVGVTMRRRVRRSEQDFTAKMRRIASGGVA